MTPTFVVLKRVATLTSPKSRLLIVGLALLILFIRMPGTFLRPELWAEDGTLVSVAYNNGWVSLFSPLSGYLNLYGNLVAKIAVQFPGAWWPSICIYAAHAATLLTVFLVTSPRFEMPYKTIAALAVVAAPASGECLLGALANSQWILPLGLVVLLFSGASTKTYVVVLEAVFVVILGLEGPQGCFLVPMFIYRTWVTSGAERKRLMVLTGILILAAMIQMGFVARNLGLFNLIEPRAYNPLLWVAMPLRWLDAARVFLRLSDSYIFLATAAVFTGAIVTRFSFKQPYRELKITMLMFAAIILYSGMYKYRADLRFQTNDRYVYAGSVFFFWFLCIWAATTEKLRAAVLAAAVVFIFSGVHRQMLEARPLATQPWSHFAGRIGSGQISIPIAPADSWRVTLSY